MKTPLILLIVGLIGWIISALWWGYWSKIAHNKSGKLADIGAHCLMLSFLVIVTAGFIFFLDVVFH